MSKYTTEVRFICETSAGYTESKGFSSIEEILTKAAPMVFNFDFPIFDENYRLVLEKKILRHYYTREIGEETVGLWKLRLNTRLNDIMPYYNKLYESELIEFNPMYNVDLTTTHDKQTDGTQNTEATGTRDTVQSNETVSEGSRDTSSSGTNETNSDGSSETSGNKTDTNWDLYSDTPQGAVTNIENETYLTNARKKTNTENSEDSGSFDSTENGTFNNTENETTGSTTNSDTSTNEESSNTSKTVATNTEEYIENVSGKTAGESYSKMLKEFRETFLNIDMMIIDELSDLFFGLW